MVLIVFRDGIPLLPMINNLKLLDLAQISTWTHDQIVVAQE